MRASIPLLAAAAAACLSAPAAAAAAPPPELLGRTAVSARIVDLRFRTSALPAAAHVRVILPTGYAAARARRYPVIYLLHGGGPARAPWTDWSRRAVPLTTRTPVILVLPEGGEGGWYTDWLAPGREGRFRWETFHIGQLIPWIDTHFRTVAARHGRAVVGLSMGGFGALSYAARHPDLFVAASSYSGDTDLVALPEAAVDVTSAFDGGGHGLLFGARAEELIRWRGRNPYDLATNLRGMTLSVRVGNGQPGPLAAANGPDPIETLARPLNVRFAERLKALGIRRVWDDYGPGTHAWPYWKRDLARDLPRIMRTFAAPPPDVPARVAFRSADPAFAVFGWSVAMHRRALEFASLTDAEETGFTLSGSGSATVVTPAAYRPGSAHRVTVRAAAGASRRTVRATAGGRLRLTVPLGAPNPRQEDTPGARTRVFTTRVAIAP